MFKSANVGSIDRLVRLMLGAILIALPFTQLVSGLGEGVTGYVVQAVGLVLILTGLVRFCPAYRLIGVNTCQKP